MSVPGYSTPRGAPLGPLGESGSLYPDRVVLRLPRNTAGRDFLLGDVRGEFDAVAARLRSVGFDAARDRLICLGDLTDRGPGSPRVSAFLRQPHVFAVRGRHDHEFAQLDPVEMRMLSRMPGAALAWSRALADDALSGMLEALRSVPLAIEVATARGLVGIASREPSRGWRTWTDGLRRLEAWALEDVLGASPATPGKCALDGLERLVVRHTPLRAPVDGVVAMGAWNSLRTLEWACGGGPARAEVWPREISPARWA